MVSYGILHALSLSFSYLFCCFFDSTFVAHSNYFVHSKYNTLVFIVWTIHANSKTTVENTIQTTERFSVEKRTFCYFSFLCCRLVCTAHCTHSLLSHFHASINIPLVIQFQSQTNRVWWSSKLVYFICLSKKELKRLLFSVFSSILKKPYLAPCDTLNDSTITC